MDWGGVMSKGVGVGMAVLLSPVAVLTAGLLLLVCVLAPAAASQQCENSDTVGTADGEAYRAPEHSRDRVAEAIASYVEAIANDDGHGYSQARRGGNPDYDCSSLVWAALKHAGVTGLPASPFTTWTMGAVLSAVGFTHLTWSGNSADAAGSLMRGDILVNPAAHTEAYVGGGRFAGARHATPSGVEDGQPGDQGKGLNQEIGISPYIDPGLTQVYRHDPHATLTTTAATTTASSCARTGSAQQAADPVVNATMTEAQQVARRLLAGYVAKGDESGEFTCLADLWQGESGWRWNARNPSSGAYGIPQALPGEKMASIGADWRTNAVTQITWGLRYIQARYGTPCRAWDTWRARNPHWY
jgi:hypothetical protein